MAWWLVIFFFLAPQFPVLAEKLNGVPLEEAQVQVDCLKIQFQDAGFPDLPHLDTQYFLRLKVENPTVQPCVVEPMRFQIIDSDKKTFDAKEIFIRYRQVEEEQSETMRPGDSWEYGIVFGPVQIDQSRPSLVYYKERLLGELTK